MGNCCTNENELYESFIDTYLEKKLSPTEQTQLYNGNYTPFYGLTMHHVEPYLRTHLVKPYYTHTTKPHEAYIYKNCLNIFVNKDGIIQYAMYIDDNNLISSQKIFI